jgi:phosphate-selective porin OprO/OprP
MAPLLRVMGGGRLGRSEWAAAATVVAAVLGMGSRARAEEGPKAPTVGMSSKDGLTVQSQDESVRMNLSAYLQADARHYGADTNHDGTDAFLLRQVRLVFTGTLAGRFDFNITPDFGGGQTVLQDAFLDARFTPALRLRIGKFKTPFGLERLQSETTLAFMERALPTDIVPNRDLGLQLHGALAGGIAYYQVGLLDGVVDGGINDADANDAKDLAARVFLQPFMKKAASLFRGLGLGMAVTNGRQAGPTPSYKTVGQLTFFAFAPGVAADGNRTRLSPQASYQRGALRFTGEWVSSRQRFRKLATELQTGRNRSWQATTSYVLTGEAPVQGVITPRQGFDPPRGHWGALEVGARYSWLEVDDAIFRSGYADITRSARRAQGFGVSASWYFTRLVKYVVNYDRTSFLGGAATGNRNPENALFFRAQVGF